MFAWCLERRVSMQQYQSSLKVKYGGACRQADWSVSSHSQSAAVCSKQLSPALCCLASCLHRKTQDHHPQYTHWEGAIREKEGNHTCLCPCFFLIAPFQILVFFLRSMTFFFFLLFSSLLSSSKEDSSHSFDCACSNKKETGRAHPLLISLAQTLVVNGKC